MAYYALLKTKYGLSPEQLNTYIWFSIIIMILKPAYGLLTDRVYIVGYRRKSYLVINGALMAILYMIIGFALNSAIWSSVVMFVINLCSSIVNSVGEALVVEDAIVDPKD